MLETLIAADRIIADLAAANRPLLEVARERLHTSRPVIDFNDPTRCFLCGDRFSLARNIRPDKWHPDCCTLCIRDRARGFGR